MTSKRILVLRDNGEWLRYVFFAGTLFMGYLLANMIASPEREAGKMFGCVMGILLCGFAGFVLRCQRFEFDPLARQLQIVTKKFLSTSSEILSFAQIRKILVLKTFESNENSWGRSEMQSRWRIALELENRTIPVTSTLYVSEQQALRDAAAIGQMLQIPVSGTETDGVSELIASGKIIDAIALVRRERGLSLAQAKEFVDKLSGRK